MESILLPPGGLPGKVLDTYEGGGDRQEEDPDRFSGVTDIGFYHLKTDKGDMTVELRVSHNGYYGGYIEFDSFHSRQDTFRVLSDMILEEKWDRVESLYRELRSMDGEPSN